MLVEIKIELGVMVHLGGRGSHGDRAGLTRSLGNRRLHCPLPLQLHWTFCLSFVLLEMYFPGAETTSTYQEASFVIVKS